MILLKNDDAVSPVIGTILIVAVTVILAAIIASFVFGSSDNVEKTKMVAFTAQMTTTGAIHVTYHGGPNADSLTAIDINAPNGSVSSYAMPNVGDVMILYPSSPSDWPSDRKHVVAVGHFNDGAIQVILDTMV